MSHESDEMILALAEAAESTSNAAVKTTDFSTALSNAS